MADAFFFFLSFFGNFKPSCQEQNDRFIQAVVKNHEMTLFSAMSQQVH